MSSPGFSIGCEDDRGNVLEVTYVAEDLQNIPQPRRSEMHRYDGLVKVTNHYAKRIRYGNTVMGEITGAVFEVVFDYGERHRDPHSNPHQASCGRTGKIPSRTIARASRCEPTGCVSACWCSIDSKSSARRLAS